MDNIKISIIVPVYKTEKYLKKCLTSIINQNFKDIEIIIVNDCSPDKSLNIIKKFEKKDKRIVVINKLKNEGLTSARNSGLEKAKGKYILHIDSDDWIEENYLKDMYETIVKYNADMVISDFYFDFGDKKIIYEIDQYGNTGTVLNKRDCIENSYPAIWNKLIKKEIYTKNNIKFPVGISIGEDLLTTRFLIYFSKKIVKLNKAYLHYFQNQNSMTKKVKYSALTDIYYVLNKIEGFLKDKDYDLFLKRLKYHHLSIWIYRVKPNFKDKLYREILKNYLFLLEMKRNKERNKKHVKYYFILRKIFSPELSFKIIWQLLYLKKNIRLLLEK